MWISGCNSILPGLTVALSTWLRCEVLKSILCYCFLLFLVPSLGVMTLQAHRSDSVVPSIPQRMSSEMQKVKIKLTMFDEAAFGAFPSVPLRELRTLRLWYSTTDPLVLSNASWSWLQDFLNNLLQLFMFLPKLLSPQAWPSDSSVSSYSKVTNF